MASIQVRVRKFHRLRERYEESNRRTKRLKRELDEFQASLYEQMRREGVISLRTQEGLFTTKSTVYAVVQDRDAFAEWCRENDLTDELLSLKPAEQRLNEIVRERIDTKQDLPPGVGWYPREYISRTDTKE